MQNPTQISSPAVKPAFQISDKALALLLAAAVAALFLLGLWLIPLDYPQSAQKLIKESIEQYEFVSSRDQRLSHLMTVGTTFAAAALGFILAWLNVSVPAGRWRLPRFGVIVSLILGFAVLYYFRRSVTPGLQYAVKEAVVLGSVYFFAMVFAKYLPRKHLNTAAAVGIAIYIAIVALPGFFVGTIPLMAAEPVALAQFEAHLLILTEPGSAVSSGLNLFSDIYYVYGLLFPSIMSVIDHTFGRLTVSDQLRFVQVCQFLFCIAATAAYLVYRPRAYFAVLVAMLLAAPFWVSAGLGIWHPNQTGYRSLGLPLCFLVLILCSHMPVRRSAWLLGMAGALAVLIDLEIAATIGFGYIVFLIARTRSIPVLAILRATLGGLVVIAVYLLLYRLALGRLPFTLADFNPFYQFSRLGEGISGLRLFSAGPWGENYFIVPLFLVMFAYAVHIIVSAGIQLWRGPLSPHASVRAGIATTLIFWLAYYFNAPNWWQGWTHLFIFGFFIIDLVDLRLLGIGVNTVARQSVFEHLWRARIGFGNLVVLLLLAYMIPYTNSLLIMYTRDFSRPYWTQARPPTGVVSGIAMPKPMADALIEKADALKKIRRETNGDVTYLTYNMAFVPSETGVFEPDPYRNLWSVAGEDAFREAIQGLIDRHVGTVLIDVRSGPLAVDGPRQHYQDRWRQMLSSAYRQTGTEGGWEIWRLK